MTFNLKHNGLQRTAIFLFISGLAYIVGGIVAYAILQAHSTNALRIATVAQDLLIFIAPALVIAVLIANKPDDFLLLDKRPQLLQLLLAVGVLIVSVPLMNRIVEWNENLHLPESMSTLEQKMKMMEDAAQGTVKMMLGDLTSWKSFIVSILVVGVMAGLSEELYFRGSLQQLLLGNKINRHVAIWLTAFIFSAIHFQFFGFFPRLLLGAFFGYIAVWCECLWIPIIVHALNNSIVVASEFDLFGKTKSAADTTLDGGNLLVNAVSFLLTGLLLYALYKTTQQTRQKDDD